MRERNIESYSWDDSNLLVEATALEVQLFAVAFFVVLSWNSTSIGCAETFSFSMSHDCIQL